MSAPRCRPGDLAVITRHKHTPELVNRFVNVERFVMPDSDGKVYLGKYVFIMEGPAWICTSAAAGGLQMRNFDGNMVALDEVVILDAALRPIRPDAGEDESFSWAGRPRNEAGRRIALYLGGQKVGVLQPVTVPSVP